MAEFQRLLSRVQSFGLSELGDVIRNILFNELGGRHEVLEVHAFMVCTELFSTELIIAPVANLLVPEKLKEVTDLVDEYFKAKNSLRALESPKALSCINKMNLRYYQRLVTDRKLDCKLYRRFIRRVLSAVNDDPVYTD